MSVWTCLLILLASITDMKGHAALTIADQDKITACGCAVNRYAQDTKIEAIELEASNSGYALCNEVLIRGGSTWLGTARPLVDRSEGNIHL
jgi:hypothetical protein